MSNVLKLFQKTTGRPTDSSDAPGAADRGAPTKSPEAFEFPAVQAEITAACRAVFHTDPLGLGSDRFRLLRMQLRRRQQTGELKTLLITSPLPHDGKSTIAINLATALCEEGKVRVLLIEADLHRPTLTQQLDLKPWSGLSDCIEDGVNPCEVVRRVEPLGWHLMPAGKPCDNPTEMLQAARVRPVLNALAPHFDWILLDSPPAVPLTDAISLKEAADAVLLVVRAGSTPQESIEEAVELIGKRHILGMVFNGVPDLAKSYSKYGYYRTSPK